MDANPLVLRHESHQLTLDPARGGTVREWYWRGRHILRPTPNGAINDPFTRACFPMTPYVNRVAGGSFRFGGRIVTLRGTNTSSLHVYTPPGQDYFCVEPVSAAAGALNRDRQEAAIVPPQGRFAVSIEFTLRVVP